MFFSLFVWLELFYLLTRLVLYFSRYNTFYILYPVGISSECTLVWRALEPTAKTIPPYWWFLVAILVIYVPGMFSIIHVLYAFSKGFMMWCLIIFPPPPGSYILYTHMIAQRRKALKKEKKTE